MRIGTGCVLTAVIVFSGCGSGGDTSPADAVAVTPLERSAWYDPRASAPGVCQPSGGIACVITSGGVYSGSWTGQDPASPVILVQTTAPVTIQDCTLQGPGDLIRTEVAANLTIRNCSGQAMNPGIAGQSNGNFLTALKLGRLVAVNNTMVGVAYGFAIGPYVPEDGVAPTGPIYIQYNQAINLNGLPSDGRGGYTLDGVVPYCGGQDNCNHFIAIGFTPGIQTPVDISWNYIQNDPGVSSVDDIINIYSSGGTPANHITIHDNYIVGGYPTVPTARVYGGGGITLDGSASDTRGTATAFVDIHDNQIVAHAGNGINMAAGHDNTAYGNRIVSTGIFPHSDPVQWYVGWAGVHVNNNYQQPDRVFFNNVAQDNISGVQLSWPDDPKDTYSTFDGMATRSDYHLDNISCDTDNYLPSKDAIVCGNIVLASPITPAMEAAEATLWAQKLISNSVTVGLTRPQGTTPGGVCGALDGATKLKTAPTRNLCTVGTASHVHGTGPWFWSCGGERAAKTARCIASR